MSASSDSYIYLVRHGETDWNKQGRMQGHTDIPLNAAGYAQAMQLSQHFAHIPFVGACSSDLSRARQTAELILKPRSLPMTETSALRERSAGALEGMHLKEYNRLLHSFFQSPPATEKESYFNTPWHPEVETSSAVLKRVVSFLCSYARSYPGQTLLAVSHGGVLRTLLDHFSFTPRMRWTVSNCGFLCLSIHEGKVELMNYEGVSQEKVF